MLSTPRQALITSCHNSNRFGAWALRLDHRSVCHHYRVRSFTTSFRTSTTAVCTHWITTITVTITINLYTTYYADRRKFLWAKIWYFYRVCIESLSYFDLKILYQDECAIIIHYFIGLLESLCRFTHALLGRIQPKMPRDCYVQRYCS